MFSHDAFNLAILSCIVNWTSHAFASSSLPCAITALTNACFFSASVNSFTVFHMLSAYFWFASSAFITIHKLSRICADHLQSQVVISSNASSIVLHIACPFNLATSIIVAISSALLTIPNAYALFALAINCVSATVPWLAFLMALIISLLAIHALSESLSNDFCNGSFSIDASRNFFHNATSQALTAQLAIFILLKVLLALSFALTSISTVFVVAIIFF